MSTAASLLRKSCCMHVHGCSKLTLIKDFRFGENGGEGVLLVWDLLSVGNLLFAHKLIKS